MLCDEYSLVKRHAGGYYAMPLLCKRWTCELCRPKRKRRLVAQVLSGKPDTFITLTVNPAKGAGPTDRATQLARAWRVVVARAKRHYGYKEIPYFVVFEATKQGEPHLHILARCKWIDQKWLSRQMREIMGAPVCDVRRVRSKAQAAHYIAKYVGKAPGKFGTCKRYWQTRSYCKKKYIAPERKIMESGKWRIVEQRCISLVLNSHMAGHYFEQGYQCFSVWDKKPAWLRRFEEEPEYYKNFPGGTRFAGHVRPDFSKWKAPLRGEVAYLLRALTGAARDKRGP